MRIYQMEKEEVAALLNTDLERGKELHPIREKKNGWRNVTSFFSGLFSLLKGKFYYVNIILMVSYFIAGVFSWLNHSWGLLYLTIAAVVLTFLLYILEGILLHIYKKKYHDRSICDSQKVQALRFGNTVELEPDELVVGDLICLQTGTLLYCDARIIESNDLFSEEKTVFGTTIPLEKNASSIQEENIPPEKQRNMLWKGSYISSGKGLAIVTAIGAECYIAKTGGRKSRKQRSFFYNRQNNIGHIASYVYIIICALCLLIAALFTKKFVEAFLLMGVLSSLMLLNPVSCLMEWTYYRIAARFYQQGILIRNIEAFDGMNKEKELYFDADKLITNQLRYSHTIDFQGTEKSTVSYFSLCMGSGYFANELGSVLSKYDLTYEKLDRSFPVFRRETDEEGNVFSLFSKSGSSVVVAAGYWKKMLPLVQELGEELLEQIHELELHGKMVYIMASDSMDFIPNKLEFSRFMGNMVLSSLVVFDLPVNQEVLAMIGQLRHSSMKVHLISDYSEALGKTLARSYDMDGFLSLPPNRPCYSIPHSDGNSLVVYKDHSSPIDRDQAMVVLENGVAAQNLVYRVKCMFCGIRRCLNFLAISGAFLIFTVMALFLANVSMEKILFPVLALTPVLICPCYYLIESVRNCNQYRRSLILGMFCGSAGFVAALIGCDAAILAFGLSTVLLSGYFLFSGAKHRAVTKGSIIILAVAFVVAILPFVFIGVNWLPAILLSLFPALGAFVLDLFY